MNNRTSKKTPLASAPLASYGFRMTEPPEIGTVWLTAVGKELRHPPGYDLHGLHREDGPTCLFQYTLSGAGRFERGGTIYEVPPGKAFLAQIPGAHRYYCSQAAPQQQWEFIYVQLGGRSLGAVWTALEHKHGPVLALELECSCLRHAHMLLQQAGAHGIADSYINSSLAYTFVMELYRSLQRPAATPRGQAETDAAAAYIREHYQSIGSLEEIVAVSGYSKYHFIRCFQRDQGMTPTRYLTKVRLERAVGLLRRTSLTLDEIAREVGYLNGNYFSKVFRDVVGVAPGSFRKEQKVSAVDYLWIE